MDSGGEFNFLKGEIIIFLIGDLELGLVEGVELMMFLMIIEDVIVVIDLAVNNKFILL